MKHILLAAAFLAFAGTAADAKGKKDASTPCMAATCTDHSMDAAYSERWADEAQSPSTTADFQVSGSTTGSFAGYAVPTTYTSFALPGFTVKERNMNTGLVRPSPYMGDNSPASGSAAANEYRNMNVNKADSRDLPPTSGNTSENR